MGVDFQSDAEAGRSDIWAPPCEHSCQPRKENYHQREGGGFTPIWFISLSLAHADRQLFTSYFPVDLNSDPGSVPGFVAAARWPPPGFFTWAKRACTLNHIHTQIGKALFFLFSYLLIFKLLIDLLHGSLLMLIRRVNFQAVFTSQEEGNSLNTWIQFNYIASFLCKFLSGGFTKTHRQGEILFKEE